MVLFLKYVCLFKLAMSIATSIAISLLNVVVKEEGSLRRELGLYVCGYV